MKAKIAGFLVTKRRLILVLFIIAAVAFGCLIPQVKVNKDMTRYLSEDSGMKRGLDIMKAEFGDENSSSLKVMFNDLVNQKQKDDILSELESFDYVDSVDYKPESSDYNKDGHTLYVINCAQDQYSEEASAIYDQVQAKYADSHDIALGGSIFEENESGLPLWIVGLAVMIIVLILIIMSRSYIEPVAFFITIGIAILINMGSYVFFDSISSTTFSIVALLQLVLSIDYSIMLLNRYRQQRLVTEDKIQAMQDSLVLSFGAITGSSITTFVGLLALLFMSFSIGADIGIALAKGVLISLLCIFTVLPAVLLGFDELMIRTKKRTVPEHPGGLCRWQYKLRVPLTLLFAGLFAFGFIVKDSVDFSYASVFESDVDKVFGKENTIVMIYNEEDSEEAGRLADSLEERDVIRSATCYENTIGRERNFSDMKVFIDDMAENTDVSMEIDNDMLKLIYYDCFGDSDSIKMSLAEFVRFLQVDVSGGAFADSIDSETRNEIGKMARFTDRSRLVNPMNSRQIADFFGMKKSQVDQLLLLYMTGSSSEDAGSMTMPAFISFIINDIASDKTYGSSIDAKTLQQLKGMQVYTDKGMMTAPVDSSTAAAMLGMDQAAMNQIFAYYEQTNGGDMTDPESWRISVQTIVNLLADDTNMSAALTAGQKAQMQNLKSVINLSVSGRKLNASQMSSALGMKSDDVRQIFILNTYKNEGTSSWKMSPHKFVGFLVSDVLTDKSMRKKMGGSAEELRMLNSIISSVVAGKTYSAKQLSDFLGAYSDRMDNSSINMLYKYYGSINSYDESWEMNLVEFVHHLDDKIISNEAYSDLIDEEMTSNVGEMRTQLDDNVALLKGEEYGRMIISAKLDVDSDDTREFFGKLTDRLDDSFNKDYYLIGSSAMAYEMSCTFKDELNRITLITALLILLVVLITFRRLAAPVILVLIIQSAVFATMAIMSFANYDMNYLALLIVQSIMMGATIDYAIIYTSYYVEVRERHMPQAALTEAFRGSFHTILTSATILFVAVGILSFAFKEEATRQICRILSLGCLIATLLVILILPAVLACCDRFVAGRNAVSGQSAEEEI